MKSQAKHELVIKLWVERKAESKTKERQVHDRIWIPIRDISTAGDRYYSRQKTGKISMS